MALRNILGSVCEVHHSSRSVMKMCVRRVRGYRDQHEKQAIPRAVLDKYRANTTSPDVQSPFIGEYSAEELRTARRFKLIHTEFAPVAEFEFRDPVRELLEREDMMKRRAKLDIPEFYVGSIMAVTLSDPYAEGKESKFVGLCIERTETGLRHNFTLRNVIDNQGIEIMYEMYNPTIKKIEVLKLEKRLDEELSYLRDAPAEYSTVPFDIEATPHPKGAPVPINSIKIMLNPKPWKERWERSKLVGFEIMEGSINARMRRKAKLRENAKPWLQHDLMRQYRESVPLEDQDEAYIHFTRAQSKIDKEHAAMLDKQVDKKGKTPDN